MIRMTQGVVIVLTALLTVAAACVTMTRASADAEAEDEPTLQQIEEDVLQVLRNGSSDERLEAADQIASTLRLGIFDQVDDSRPFDDLVDGLILILHQETDDWIGRTLLDSLSLGRNQSMNRLFREALGSTSINIQAMAIRHFSFRDDPDAVESLESLWGDALPPWVRVDLIAALAEQGSTTHAGGIIRLTRDDDPGLREAAIEALDVLAPPEAIPALVRVARTGTPEDREAAVEALGAFPDSEEALQEALGASRSDDTPILRAAVRALGRLARPDADSRLIALLDDPPGPDLRGSIAKALEDSAHPDATDALVRLLHESDVGTDSWIRSTVLRVLHNRDDPDAVPGLRDLAAPPAEDERDEIAALIAYLSRNRSTEGASTIITSSCSYGAPVLPGNPRAWHVAPPAPRISIRCWDAPDRMGDPEDRQRILAGTRVLIEDHFDARGEAWVQIRGSDVDDCWVPHDELRQGAGPGAPSLWNGRHIRFEFDIETEDLGSPHALRLSESGLLETFEPGEEVAGVALEIDASDQDQMGLVRALRLEDDGILDSALRLVLDLAESDD